MSMPRYIDAEALKQSDFQDFSNTDVFSAIDNAPTADVAPVRRGKWVLVGQNAHEYVTSIKERCSLCGRYVYRYDAEPTDNFCPSCGADMREEK